MPRPYPAMAALLLLPFCAIAQDADTQAARLPEAFQLGLGLQQRGLHEEAEAQFAAFLQQNPNHRLAAEAGYRRGACLLQLERRGPAIAVLREALTRGGDDFALRHEARYRLATALKDESKNDDAARELAALLAALPKDHYLQAGAHYALGECQRDLGDDAHALASFAAAAQRATGEQQSFLFPAHYQAGFAALRLQQPQAAVAQFAAAVPAAGDPAARHECEFLAGDAALRQGDLDTAQRWLEQAQQGGGEWADDSELALGFVATARGDAAAARQVFERFARARGDSPLQPRALLEIGRLSYQLRDYPRAEQVLQPLASSADAAVQRPAKELLGLCALASGRSAVAIEPLREALAHAAAAEQPRLSFALAEALANAGKYEEALPPYATASSSTEPGLRGDALYGACFALHQLGRFDESTARAELLRKELPQHRLVALATFACGENRFAQKQYEAAQRDYAAVAAASEPRAKAEFKFAWCRYLLGDRKDAAQRFLGIGQPQAATKELSPHAEEALSMAALALLEANDAERALATADAYRARYPEGLFLDRTERVAARVLRARGDLQGAAQRLALAGKRAKDGAGDQLEQAEVEFQRGDFQAAAALYAPLAQRTDATGARALEGAAWCAFELGDDAACAQRLEQGLRHPQAATVEPTLLELASALHHRQKDWAKAIAVGQRYLQAHGKNKGAPAMRYALGVALARSGDQKAARALLNSLATDGGHDRMDRVHYELAWSCRRDGDEAAALAAFARVVELSQDEDLAGEARLHLGTAAQARGDHASARAQLAAVPGRHRGRALYQLGTADLAAADKDPSLLTRAEAAFAAVAELADEPLAPEATFLLAECRRRHGDHQGAAAAYRALLERAPQHERVPLARLGLAEMAVLLGDGDTAVQEAQRFLASEPKERTEQARAQLALGRGRQQRKETERAEQAFAKVTDLSDGQLAAEAQYRLGEVRAAAGNLQGAVDAFVKLPILYAHAEWVAKGLLAAGLCCEQLQQPEKARRFFTELVQRFPDTEEAGNAKARLSQKQ